MRIGGALLIVLSLLCALIGLVMPTQATNCLSSVPSKARPVRPSMYASTAGGGSGSRR